MGMALLLFQGLLASLVSPWEAGMEGIVKKQAWPFGRVIFPRCGVSCGFSMSSPQLVKFHGPSWGRSCQFNPSSPSMIRRDMVLPWVGEYQPRRVDFPDAPEIFEAGTARLWAPPGRSLCRIAPAAGGGPGANTQPPVCKRDPPCISARHHAGGEPTLPPTLPSTTPKITLPVPIPALHPWDLVPSVLGMRRWGQTGITTRMLWDWYGSPRPRLAQDEGWEGGGAGAIDGFALAAAVLQPLSVVKLPGKI